MNIDYEFACRDDCLDQMVPSDLRQLVRERDEAREYAQALYEQACADRHVTCVYCGHVYEDGTPESQDQRLTDHIKVCDKHPMRKAEAMVDRLAQSLYQFMNEDSPQGLRTMRSIVITTAPDEETKQAALAGIDALLAYHEWKGDS